MSKLFDRLNFGVEWLFYKGRELFSPPEKKLREIGIQPGWSVMDFGCGIGSYSLVAAKLVGEKGTVYAIDIKPAAANYVKTLAAKKGLTKIQTIITDCDTGLASGVVDVVLLYDVFHDLEQPVKVMNELARVLKPGGILSFSDHHMKDNEILSKITAGGKYTLQRKGNLTYTFIHAGS